jgi:hypothetical protein
MMLGHLIIVTDSYTGKPIVIDARLIARIRPASKSAQERGGGCIVELHERRPVSYVVTEQLADVLGQLRDAFANHATEARPARPADPADDATPETGGARAAHDGDAQHDNAEPRQRLEARF